MITLPDTQIQPRESVDLSKVKKIIDSLDISEATRRDYMYRIPAFVQFIEQHGIDNNLFLDFKRSLASRNDYSIATKNKYLGTSRIFLRELNRLGILPLELTANVKAFPQNKKHKKDGLSEDEVKKVSSEIDSLPSSAKNARLKALFCLLALQGLRQCEIVRLDASDIDISRKPALVIGKGKVERELIHLHPKTVVALDEYMESNTIRSGALFFSLGNRKSDRLTTMTIKREMKALFEQLSIKKTVHGFRHTFVTTLLKALDVRDVRKFSRHANLDMLIVYDDEIDIAAKSTLVFEALDRSFDNTGTPLQMA